MVRAARTDEHRLLLGELTQAERKFRRSQAKADADGAARNAVVARCLTAGLTHTEIAVATGLSRGRVAQLVPGAPKRRKKKAAAAAA